MIRASAGIDVSQSPDEVYSYVADLRNEPTWHTDIASVPAEADPTPVVGSVTHVKFKPFMGKTDGVFTVLDVQLGSKIVFKAELAGFAPTVTYLVEPAGGGARFTRSVEMEPKGFMKLMSPMMRRMVPKRNAEFVQNLKRALEK
jgi:carbon monoxide dehydrogenase subunit G